MSLLRFTSLSGARSSDNERSGSILSHVLQIDNCRILLDCGATTDLDPIDFRSLVGMAKHIDAVLLSHADVAHLGAYAYAFKMGLTCPAYATIPVADLGKLCMREALHDKRSRTDFALFDIADIQTAFEHIEPLRYSQAASLAGRGKGITVTAYQAGHSLGGTLWKIKKGTDDIIYAVDYNHQKEQHLDRTVLNAKELERPSLLITDAFNAQYSFSAKRNVRDQIFIENIKLTLLSGGNVLIPVSSTTRALELTFLLQEFWNKDPDCAKLSKSLYFLSPQSPRIIQAAKRMVEWMGEGIARIVAHQIHAPYDFAHIKSIQNLSEIEDSPAPKVILAPSASLETGCARTIFLEWCESGANTILLPGRGDPKTLGHTLYQEWMGAEKQNEALAINLNFPLKFVESRRVPLEGAELKKYQLDEAARKEAIAAAAELAKLAAMEENDSDLSDNEGDALAAASGKLIASSEGAAGGLVGGTGFGNVYDIYVKDSYKASGFFKQNQSFRTFPVSNQRGWVDDYGEAVDPTLFVNADQAAMEEANDELPALQLEETQDLQDTIPSKYVDISVEVTVRCKVIFIDFEGRSDGKSVKNIIKQVSPRKLILVHGSEEATTDLEHYCHEDPAVTNDVFTPFNNEWINVSAATDVHEIKLTDSLVSTLATSKIHDYELAFVSGFIKANQSDDTTIQDDEDKMEVDGTVAETLPTVPTLDILPSELSRQHRPVLVGDVKLSEFRKILVSKGFETEFVAGVLIVNRSIMIRKSQQGRILLEGALSADYYACRKLLYAQHAIL